MANILCKFCIIKSYGGWHGAVVSTYDYMHVRHEFKPDHGLQFFPQARNFTLIAQYWLVLGMDFSLIYMNRSACFTIQLKYISINLSS